jgi:UDP-N-acetyl-2-amino-2-deoxyglucuronate dehydrogenase
LKLGLIGCGNISDAHLNGLRELKKEGRPSFEISAVCDIDRDKAEGFATKVKEKSEIKPNVYTDYRNMLEKENMKAVSILITHDLHHTVAEDCFAAGVHVQMQKPLAISPSFGRKMIDDAHAQPFYITKVKCRSTSYF